MRVAVVTTHPIQYQIPWLQRLARTPDIQLHVFFAMLPDAAEQGREFGVAFAWDLPLLDGYDFTVLANRAKHPSLTRFSGCDTPQIYAELRRGNWDAVIVNGWVVKTCVQALIACRLAGIPCLVRGEVNGLRPRVFWKRWLHRLLLRQYSAFLAIGTRNREYYLERGVDARRIFSTPYCVDNMRFSVTAKDWRDRLGRIGLCEKFTLSPERTTFLFSGKLVEKKRPGDLIGALEHLDSAELERLQVLIVGDGPLAPELRARAQTLPVRFAGFLNQSEIGAAYAVSDCLVLPSDHGETWGLVVNEAMACGLPAVLSDQVGSARDLVAAGVTGEIFACGDTKGLARLLAHYARAPSALKTMGQTAQACVARTHNFDLVVAGVNLALASVCKE